MRKKSEIGEILKGDTELHCGVTANVYFNIHKWLNRKFGSANKCEGQTCVGKSKKFEYALLKGKEYEKKRENFIMLCHSCHVIYDWDENKRQYMRVLSPETREKIGRAQIGRKKTDEQKERMSLMMAGENNPMYGVRKFGLENHFFGKKHNDETKKKIFDAAAKLTKEQIVEIRNRHKLGEPQKDIATAFGLNRPRVCKIVNQQIYKSW